MTTTTPRRRWDEPAFREMLKHYVTMKSYAAIGRECGVSRERVRQWVNAHVPGTTPYKPPPKPDPRAAKRAARLADLAESRRLRERGRHGLAARLRAHTTDRPLTIVETLTAISGPHTRSTPYAVVEIWRLWGRHDTPTATAAYHALCARAGVTPRKPGRLPKQKLRATLVPPTATPTTTTEVTP